MDALETLVAIEGITQLKARYFRTLDGKDWAGFSQLFTPEAQMDMRAELLEHAHDQTGALLRDNDPVLTGPAAITEFVSAALPEGVITVHLGHTHEISITGPESAHGVWAMSDYVDHGEAGFRGYGHYHESYRRLDGIWLIDRLLLRRIRVDWF
jgi:hypothetical protein